ncbi:hypothetical protein [Klebsiella pneumoniae]|uniref:Y-family DNA polymerase n=1 Tax=Klebsiella pneumoniae TaxID=573 RepID=UPI0039751825
MSSAGNNDGNVIARGAEAKPWIKMGTPWFQIKNEGTRKKYISFQVTMNFTPRCRRVMNCLEELAPEWNSIRIDEMFLDLTGVEHCMGLRTSAGSCVSTCMTVPA